MPGTPIDLQQLRAQVETAEEIYGLLGPEVKKEFPMRWRFAESQTSSAERLSSTFLGRASGLDLSLHPTAEQQRDAILNKWELEAERALPRSIPNRRPQLETFDGLRKIMIDLANKSFEVVSSQEKLLAQSRAGAARNAPVFGSAPPSSTLTPASVSPGKSQSPTRGVTTTTVDPNTPFAEPARLPRSTGPSRSTTGLETFVTGKYVSTNSRGEFSISIKPTLRELENRILDLEKRASIVREDSKKEIAAQAYFELLDMKERGRVVFDVPTKDEFMKKVDAIYSSVFNAEALSRLILQVANEVETEAKDRTGHTLTSKERVNLLFDLAVSAETVASRVGGRLKDELPNTLEGLLMNDGAVGVHVSAADLVRVMSKPHSRTFTDPSVQFESGLRR